MSISTSSSLFPSLLNSHMLVFQDGWTPLHIAVQSRNRDIVKILLVNGADKSRRNKVTLTIQEAGGLQ